ncbi:MAG: SufE family protein, partial [Clostridia bacterium]|nr:SufE family protein [Clostridia bacterium]
QYLVDLGGELEGLSAEEKNDDTLIKGCQSQVWLVCDEQEGRLYFRGESDAIIVKGIVALLINMMSGCTAEEVVKYNFGFLDKIGLKEHLSPTRSNGLVSMVEKMKAYALLKLKV